MRVTARGFRYMADRLVALADEVCEGRVVCALEGGYDLEGLAGGVLAVLDAFTDPNPATAEQAAVSTPAFGGDIAPGARAAIDQTLRALQASRGDAR